MQGSRRLAYGPRQAFALAGRDPSPAVPAVQRPGQVFGPKNMSAHVRITDNAARNPLTACLTLESHVGAKDSILSPSWYKSADQSCCSAGVKRNVGRHCTCGGLGGEPSRRRLWRLAKNQAAARCCMAARIPHGFSQNAAFHIPDQGKRRQGLKDHQCRFNCPDRAAWIPPPRHCNSKGSGGRPAFACMTRPASGRARPSPGHVAAHLRYGMRSGSIEGLAAPRSGAFGIRLAVQRYAHDKKNSRGYPCPSMPIRVSVERIFDIFRTFHVIVSRSFST